MNFLYSKEEIAAALAIGPVFAKIPELDPSRKFVVRDVELKKRQGDQERVLRVRTLEGWRKPSQVYTEA